MDYVITDPKPGESFWMIERKINGNPHWWRRSEGQYGDAMLLGRWTVNVSDARKYDSKASAEFVMGTQMPGCVATEHLMMSGDLLGKSGASSHVASPAYD